MGKSPDVDGGAPIHLFASPSAWIEGAAVRQLEDVARLDGVTAVAAMPDLHPGKLGPVGCAILAARLYPQLVGSDIGCGMGLFRLDVSPRKLRLERLAERLAVLDQPWDGARQEALAAAGLVPGAFDSSLGSIGGGNHFCEVQAIEEIVAPDTAAHAGLKPDATFVLVHSGSRGLGASILASYLTGGIAALEPTSEAGRDYLRAHDAAVAWARLNRALIAERAAAAAGADLAPVVDLAHNMVEMTATGALHRKGAAAADRGLVPVPGSRGTLSYLMQPAEAPPAGTLASLAHGAGRKHDRASMHGRVPKKRSDLARLARNRFGGHIVCGDRDLLVEEAPEAYKPIERVIGDLVDLGLARVVATFRPLVTFKKAAQGGLREADRRERRGRGDRRRREDAR